MLMIFEAGLTVSEVNDEWSSPSVNADLQTLSTSILYFYTLNCAISE